jgi:formylglycine-generating enzyme required for sulfatase activity
MPLPVRVRRASRLAGAVLGLSLAAVLVSAAAPHGAAGEPGADVAPLPAGTFRYQAVGEFLRNGVPVDAPRAEGRVRGGLFVQRRLVSQAEYARCVRAGACKRLDKGFRDLEAPDRPAVGVSWEDATAYARWWSRQTGRRWRLPAYAEWVRAAAERYQEEGALPSDPDDPAVRWLAEYERETRRSQGRVKPAQPFGHFGVNSLGLSDVAGNVWEWTTTCFERREENAPASGPVEDCGVRVLAGVHAAAMPDFIRDPRSGACSVGLPPANLGFRLVLDTAPD